MKKLITFLTAAAIFCTIFSPIQLVFAGGRALICFVPSVFIILYDRLYRKKQFVPVALYMCTALIILFSGSEYLSIPFLVTTLFAYVVLEHYLVSRDEKYARIVLVTLYGALLMMVFISIPLFISIPNLSRLMRAAEENGISNPLLFCSISYHDIHSLPIYSIPLFYLAKNRAENKWLRFFSFLSIIAIFILMLFADATTPLILNVIIYIIMFLYNPNQTNKSNFIKFVGVGIMALILINKSLIISLLTIVQPLFIGSSTYKKIDELISSIAGQGSSGDLEAREDRLNTSIDSFMSNPFMPEMKKSMIGGHNALIDHIVAMGLLPGITFIWFLVRLVKRPIALLNSQNTMYYYISVLAFFVMGFTKNFLLFMPTFSIVPMMLFHCNSASKSTYDE